jgi:hypothetical protein
VANSPGGWVRVSTGLVDRVSTGLVETGSERAGREAHDPPTTWGEGGYRRV